jgi:endonuclease/exonuclease/phosphatase family metal-dependent hydrolase
MLRLVVLLWTLMMMTTVYANPLKVFTYNAFMLPWYASNSSQNERAKLIADYLLKEDFDVICLQEVFTRKSYKIITRKLNDKYYNTGRPYRKWYKFVNSGLVIYSKYPIVDQRFYRYRGLKHADGLSSKGILAVTLEIDKDNDKYVQLINTHLQAQQGKKYERIRKRNYQLIKDKIINGYHNKDYPLILTGDYNIDQHDTDEFKPFEESLALYPLEFNSELQYTVDSTINTLHGPHSDGSDNLQVLDYVFLLPGNTNAWQVENQILDPQGRYGRKGKIGSLSDHQPVLSIIDL